MPHKQECTAKCVGTRKEGRRHATDGCPPATGEVQVHAAVTVAASTRASAASRPPIALPPPVAHLVVGYVHTQQYLHELPVQGLQLGGDQQLRSLADGTDRRTGTRRRRRSSADGDEDGRAVRTGDAA
jgi:hypothetical protein